MSQEQDLPLAPSRWQAYWDDIGGSLAGSWLSMGLQHMYLSFQEAQMGLEHFMLGALKLCQGFMWAGLALLWAAAFLTALIFALGVVYLLIQTLTDMSEVDVAFARGESPLPAAARKAKQEPKQRMRNSAW
eukprot:CAMPEP_0202412616 /NCGR_PEP_ID=MMETSP1128-20130828/26335_1 /ASSEMBLY_ACC=CAM_ASM_000463 /TAXON_ID=3047 /ORGANISM="Dunaliella tertiolecta, Strain CCMP1320" /LENGTH=130 /DNA_ID=CAMNT_0049018567 /DNA_START=137 /DNA_END=526 /DNA_ORIENTATION=-